MTLKLLKLGAALAMLAAVALPAMAAPSCSWSQSYDAVFNQWIGVRSCSDGCVDQYVAPNGGQWSLVAGSGSCGYAEMN